MPRPRPIAVRPVRPGAPRVHFRAAIRPTAAALALAIALAAALGAVHGAAAAPRTASDSVASVPGTAADSGATVVLVMRHAERADGGGADPGLSEAGAERARALASAASRSGVGVILTTQYVRTRETAAPLAAETGAPVVGRPVTAANAASYAADLAREIRTAHAGRTVAVVGHSNTVPAIVAALAGGPAPTLGEGDYGDLFVVILPPAGGEARVLRTRVGR